MRTSPQASLVPRTSPASWLTQAEKTGGLCNGVESFLSLACTHPEGPGIHYTTYESAVHGFGDVKELRTMRKTAPWFRDYISPPGPKLPRRDGVLAGRAARIASPDGFVQGSSRTAAWETTGASGSWDRTHPSCASPNTRSRRPTSHFPSTLPRKSPCHMGDADARSYMVVPSTWVMIKFLMYGALFAAFARFGWGRKFLLKVRRWLWALRDGGLQHPSFFSGGLVSHEGPSEAVKEQTSFVMTFFGQGPAPLRVGS